MPLSIVTNLSSLLAQTSLDNNTNNLNKSLQQLSTGLRINSGADDPAGLYISQGLSSQVNGTSQAESNVQTGINVISIADGALATIQTNLQQIRSLAVQAADDSNGTSQRTAILNQINSLKNEINQIATSTTFNGQSLLSGAAQHYRIQVGANASTGQNTIDIGAANSALGGGGSNYLGISAGVTQVDTNAHAEAFLTAVDSAINKVSTQRASLGSYTNRLQAALSNLQSLNQNYTSARSTIQDTDIASTTAALTQQQILQQASATVLLQANQTPTLALKLITG